MAKIVYIQPDGREFIIDVKPGMSLMEGAVKNAVPGLDADCGGACACATCHVYVEESWRAATGEPELMEKSMLEFAAHPRARSRLSCQITVTDKLDGLVVRIPESQK